MSEKPVPFWPKSVTAPVVLPQPEAERFVAECICPIGANLACENQLCPRKNVMNIVAIGPRK